MPLDRPLLGISLMLGFCILAPLGDSLAKLLGATVPLLMLITLRFAAQALILVPVARVAGQGLALPRRALGLNLLRTLLHIAGIAMMFTALRHLPLADAVAIAFVMPFLMLLLGKYVLGEQVGPRRLIACAVGFAGTMLVIRPAFADVGWAALWPLGVAVNFALFMLVGRSLSRQAAPIALQATGGLMACALLLPLLAAGWAFDLPALAPIRPTAQDMGLMALMGAVGTLAHLLMTWSLRYAPSATLAPMQYLEIPFATAFGWLIFNEWPDGLAALGIAITVAAGLYIILRERATARAPRAPAPPAA